MSKKHGVEDFDRLKTLRDDVFEKLGGPRDENSVDMPIGLTGIGIGIRARSKDGRVGIKVLCMDAAAKKRFQATAGDSIEGVPIYYEVTGEIRAL